MPSRAELPFAPVDFPSTSPSPSFNIAFPGASTANALESTGLRQWNGPTGRAVRLAETGGVDVYINFGTSDVVAASTNSMMMLGNTVEVFSRVRPGMTHIAVFSSTSGSLNVTLGYGQ